MFHFVVRFSTLPICVPTSMQTIEFGNPAEALAALAFISLIAGVLAVVVYVIMTQPHQRRAEYQSLGGCSPRVGFIFASLIALGIIGASGMPAVFEFSRVEFDGNNLHLHFCLPPRRVVLPVQEVARLDQAARYGKGAPRFQFVIETTRGKRYRSLPVREAAVEAALESLRPIHARSFGKGRS